jgi:cytochrome c5
MGEHDDKVFLKRFSGIIAGLVIVTVLIIIISTFREEVPNVEDNPSRLALAAERIAPVAGVRTELPAASAEEPAAEEPVQMADAGTVLPAAAGAIDGAAIYQQTCQACHMTGAAGAPVPGTEAFSERAAKGVDALVASAVDGLGMMPPKGGRMDLDDAQIRAAVEHMLAQ